MPLGGTPCGYKSLAEDASPFNQNAMEGVGQVVQDVSTRPLYFSSCCPLIQPTVSGSSENFFRWHDSVWWLKSGVKFKQEGGKDSSLGGGGMLLITVPDMQSAGQVIHYSGHRWSGYLHAPELDIHVGISLV